MIISESAKIYAKSLIEIANNNDAILEVFNEDLDKADSILDSSSDLVTILDAPTVSFDKKNLVIEDVFSSQVSTEILNLIKILAEKSKVSILKQILNAFHQECDTLHNVKRVEVVSAIELSETQKNKIIEKINQKLSKKIIANWQINTDIIGGLIINFDDTVIDTSVKNKLEKIKGNL